MPTADTATGSAPNHSADTRAAATPPGPPAAALTTGHIVYLVVAAAAPLSAIIGTVPLAFAVGNGPGVPAAFVFAGVTLFFFAVGYRPVIRLTGGSGGFYTAVAAGLGRTPAGAAGYLALVSYNAATIGLVGAFGYFSQEILARHGISVPWELCAAVGLVAVAFLGHREAELAARVVAFLMIGEIGVLLALDVSVLARHGFATFPTSSFSPGTMTGPGVGVSVMFAFVSFIGFESAALYGGEARNPHRSVPRAICYAALFIAVFYAVTSWAAVGALGPTGLREAAREQGGDLFFNLAETYLGRTGDLFFQVLLCTSLFAATLALHNAANRYTVALAADVMLPAWLGARSRTTGAPVRASLVQVAICAAMVAVFALVGAHPYTGMTTSMLGLGTLGIVLLQALAALSVLGLRRVEGAAAGSWPAQIAPLLALAGLIATLWLAISNFGLLTGSDSPAVTLLPWLLLPAALAGAGRVLWLRQSGRSAPCQKAAPASSRHDMTGQPPAVGAGVATDPTSPAHGAV
ncbi:APC family permease [Frankia sp. Ag45/Mut15]|uniref:APC family permease n=1 Tax=Frankia umida TaxID=573489 RepID=A0ABT0K4Y8_9ACTN|nr:APC family permease [Frankia umida]MCK9878845.1 APC family permease [Frankia umida]